MNPQKLTLTEKQWMRQLARATCLLFVSVTLECCTTISPAPVESHSVAFDGSAQTAGIIGVRGGKFQVDSFFIEVFNARLSRFGGRFSPPARKLPADTTQISEEQMCQSLAMARYEREERVK